MVKKSLTRLVIFLHLMTTTMPLGASGPGQKLPLFEEERAGPSMPRLNPVSSHPASSRLTAAQFSWDGEETDVGRPAASASIPSKDAVQWNALCHMWSSGGKNRDLSRAAVLEIAQKEGPHQEEALSLLSTSDDPEDQKFVLALTNPSGRFPLGTFSKNLPERLLTNPLPAGPPLRERFNPGIVPSALTTTSLSNPSAPLGSGGLFKSTHPLDKTFPEDKIEPEIAPALFFKSTKAAASVLSGVLAVNTGPLRTLPVVPSRVASLLSPSMSLGIPAGVAAASGSGVTTLHPSRINVQFDWEILAREGPYSNSILGELRRIALDETDPHQIDAIGRVIQSKDAKQEQDSVTLLPSVQKLIRDRNDPKAQSILGYMYEHGRGGLPKDDREAVRFYRLAADQGFAKAQYNLGRMYEHGRGVAKDEREAVRFFRLAADQGDQWAQYNLGVMYANGQGVARDDREAVRLYRLAADQGYAMAQSNLGVMYRDGRGVVKDEREAIRIFKLSKKA